MHPTFQHTTLGQPQASSLARDLYTLQSPEATTERTSARRRTNERLQRFDHARNWRILEALDEVSERTGASPAQISLAWLLERPAVTSVIFGARSIAQLEENLAAAELTLDAEALARLDEASAFEVGYPYTMLQRVQGSW